MVSNDRPAFLNKLKEAGCEKLTDRQAFANAIGKGQRAGWLRPPFTGPFTEAARELREAREKPALKPRYPEPVYNKPFIF